jgi:hypothetical protein
MSVVRARGLLLLLLLLARMHDVVNAVAEP